MRFVACHRTRDLNRFIMPGSFVSKCHPPSPRPKICAKILSARCANLHQSWDRLCQFVYCSGFPCVSNPPLISCTSSSLKAVDVCVIRTPAESPCPYPLVAERGRLSVPAPARRQTAGRSRWTAVLLLCVVVVVVGFAGFVGLEIQVSAMPFDFLCA